MDKMYTLPKFLLSIIVMILVPLASFSYTTVSGDISGQVWTSGNTYYVTGTATVNNNTVLEIEAGAVVKFAPGVYMNIRGTMIAVGTNSDQIIFTSRDDDSVGEIITDSDGDPNPGDWSNLYFQGNSSNQGIANMDYCQVLYAGSNAIGNASALYMYNCDEGYVTNSMVKYSSQNGVYIYQVNDLTFDSNTVSDNANSGVLQYTGQVNITNCQLDNNGEWPLRIDNSSLRDYAGNSGSGNNYDAIAIRGTVNQDLTISESISGLPFVVNGLITVIKDISLTFLPGEIIKLTGGQITINGFLFCEGTDEAPITFTSFKDDETGGDLNNDGNLLTEPAPGDWYTLNMRGNSTNQGQAIIDHTIFKYGGANYSGEAATVYFYQPDEGTIANSTIMYSAQNGLRLHNSAQVTVDNLHIANSNGHGILNSSSEVNITNCELNNNADWAIYIDNAILHEYPGNSGSGNGYDAIAIKGTVNQDMTISESISGLPFVVNGLITVIKDISLTFLPGEIIKLTGGQITINGFLFCEGTDEAPITFTSFKDDETGGDLNNDGNLLTEPAPGDWYTLNMRGNSTNQGQAIIDHTIFKYGGANYSGEAATVYFYQPDEGTITNSTIMYSAQNGLRLQNSAQVTVDNLHIANSNGHGILNSSSEVDIANCELNNNADWAIYIDNAILHEYPGNSGSGNGYDAIAIRGTVDQDLTISESISGLPFVVNGLITVIKDISLTFLPGEIIKLTGGQITINGFLYCEGTDEAPITFTSFKDDETGGDLNNDGNLLTEPAPGDWYTINMRGNSTNQGQAIIDHTIFKYGGANYSGEVATVYFYQPDEGTIANSTIMYSAQNGLRLQNSAQVTVDNLHIANSNGHGILNSSSEVDITNCELNNNADWAIYIDNAILHEYPGNSGSGNGYDAIAIKGTVNQDMTISESISGLPFVVNGLVTVNDGISLTIPEGEVIKLINGQMQLNGWIYCNGTPSQPIVFTSIYDDENGGDLNGDGNLTTPSSGDWYTISVSGNGANDGKVFIEHCRFLYGGANYNGDNAAVYFYAVDEGYFKNCHIENSAIHGIHMSQSSGVEFSDNVIKNAGNLGIYNNGSIVDIIDCQIQNSGQSGIYLNATSALSKVEGCFISGNGDWALKADNAKITEFSGNSGSGNFYNAFGIYGSTVESLEMSKAKCGFPFVIRGILTITTGDTISIPAGEIVKMTAATINVEGALIADGHVKDPVVFTSFKDDENGGDLNNDGQVNGPNPGDWQSIYVNGNGNRDGILQLDNCLVTYGGANYNSQYANIGLYRTHPDCFITYSTIENSLYHGIRSNDGHIKIRSSYIRNNTDYGVYTQGTIFPDMGSVVQTNGGFNHIMDNNGGDHQIYHNAATSMDAYYNDWGVYSAPQIDELLYDNEETGNSGMVHFNPWFDPDDDTFFLETDFTVDFTQIHVGGAVHFTDQSFGFPIPDRWEWDFTTNGDVESEETNPYHAYSSEGFKTVCLVVSNGAYSKTIIKEDLINVGNYGAPDITTIEDVPNDQGGKVYVHFSKSEFDTSTLVTSNEYYTVQLNDGNGWFSAGYSSAFGSPTYTVMTQTPFDSTQFDSGLIDFRVIASMDEGNYTSGVVQGYSVDNISPEVPEGLDAVLTDTLIYLTWNSVSDPDFHYFGVYRSEDPDIFPDEPYVYVAEPAFTDSVETFDFFFYKVTAFDYTGNESDGSSVIETARYHDISIDEGWQGVSTYFNPVDADIENLFAPVIDNIILMENQAGLYWPDQNINTLGDWDFKSGYIFKSGATSEITNVLSTRQDEKVLELQEGWNLIPVLSSNNVGVIELFTEADIEIVKEVAGWRVYWPELSINSMVTVNTGAAYFVLSNAEQTIIFPDLGGTNAVSLPQPEAINMTPWNQVVESPGSHVIGFNQKALQILKAGDFIGAFTNDEVCAGMVKYEGNNLALSVFGDDLTTAITDGFEDYESITLRVYRPETDETFDLDVTYNPARNQGNFEAYGISEITEMKLSATGISDVLAQDVEIYPNPSNGVFDIELNDNVVDILIFDSYGNEIMKSNDFNAGKVDLTQYPNGVYYLKATSEEINIIRKLVKE